MTTADAGGVAGELRPSAGNGLDARALLAALGQEIVAPVQGMVALGEILQRHPLSLDGAACLQALLDQGRQLQAMLAEVGAHLRGGLRPEDLDLEPVAPTELLDDLASGWTRLAEQRSARLVVVSRCDPTLLVEADPRRLRQVLAVLVSDALAHCPGGALELQMSAEPDEGHVRLVITLCDTGVRDRESPPTLNLAVAAQIVRAMGGALEAVGNAGQGVTRTMSLRLRRAQAPEMQAQAPPELQVRTAHVLIVDDNMTNRTVAEALCGMFGFSSETAEDGQAAVEAVTTRDFDLILMDIRMPRMDGVEATRRIRALPGAAARTPILALTANADEASIRDYLAAGMDDVVEKPIKPERLLAALRQALEAEADRPDAATVQPLFALQG